MGDINIVQLQQETDKKHLIISSLIMFILMMGMGSARVYVGLTLEHNLNQNITEQDREFILLTREEASTYLSIQPLCAVIGTLVGSPIGERIGRKYTLILSAIISFAGFVVMYFSDKFWQLLAGRIINMFGGGIGLMMPIILVTEISTIKARAPLSAFNLLGVLIGTLLAYLSVVVFSASYLIFICSGIFVLFLLLCPFLLESPHYLIRKKRLNEAREVYRKLRGPKYQGIEAEVQEVQEICIAREAMTGVGPLARWKEQTFKQPLAIILVLFFLLSLNGVNCPLTFYGPLMFSEFGFTLQSELVTCIIPTGQVLGFLLSPIGMKVMSKRTLYMWTSVLMSIFSIVFSITYYFKDPTTPPSWILQVAMVASCLGLTICSGCGMTPITYAISGELLSPEDKSIGMSLGQCLFMLLTTVLLKVYPMLVEILGYSILFILHTVTLVMATLFVFRFMPETRNKTLTEIRKMFSTVSKTENDSS